MGFILTHPSNSVDLTIKANQANDTYGKTWKNELPVLSSFYQDGSSRPSSKILKIPFV